MKHVSNVGGELLYAQKERLLFLQNLESEGKVILPESVSVTLDGIVSFLEELTDAFRDGHNQVLLTFNDTPATLNAASEQRYKGLQSGEPLEVWQARMLEVPQEH